MQLFEEIPPNSTLAHSALSIVKPCYYKYQEVAFVLKILRVAILEHLDGCYDFDMIICVRKILPHIWDTIHGQNST